MAENDEQDRSTRTRTDASSSDAPEQPAGRGGPVDPDKVDLSGAPQAQAARDAGLEHTNGGNTTRDAMDAGVPMIPGDPNEPIGPEDAMGPGPKRGDYSDRLNSGPHMMTVENPDADVDAGEPRYMLVPADEFAEAGNQADEPGKGGVSTEAARQGHAA